MKTWQENVTVLSVSKMYKDKLSVCGVNDEGKWRRLNGLSHYDFMDGKQTTLKLFSRSKVICYAPKMEMDGYILPEEFRPEDCYALSEPKPRILNEINSADRNIFIKNHLDGGVEEAFKRDRSLGLVKPLVEQVYFGWNSLFNAFESHFVFQDKSGQRYKFICTDLKWFYSWMYLFQKKKELLYQELNELPSKLNRKDTFFVIGLSKPVQEVPGGYRGCWPLVLGIHSF